MSAAGTDASAAIEVLVNHYDDQVCALVARLEADDPPLLAQIRSDASAVAAVTLLIIEEFSPSPRKAEQRLGPLDALGPYLAYRRGEKAALPELPIPEDFRRTFRNWAEGRVNFASTVRGGQP